MEARAVAEQRFSGMSWKLNSQIPSRELRGRFKAERAAMSHLHSELDAERLSARGFHKVLRLSWSIADRNGHHIPTREDVELALVLRQGMEQFQ